MYFHNSCTQNCDHHIFLIMTGNAHKESCHKLLSLILMRKHGLYIIKTDGSGKMVVASTIKEKTISWGAYFANWCCRFPICIWGIELLIWLRYWSCFRHSFKSDYCSLYIQFYKLFWFYVDFFLNLGFCYNDVKYGRK